MIIFGTRGVTSRIDNGSFYCPECRSTREYAKKRVRRFFTLYFIPVIPLDTLGEYIECKFCKNTFRENVLDYRPEAAATNFEAEFHKSIRRVMILMMLADGEIGDSEIQSIQQIYSEISGSQISQSDVRKEIAIAYQENLPVTDYLKRVSPYLNDNGKELVLRSAFIVAAADGVLQKEERKLLTEIAQAIQMSPSHFRGVLAEFASNA
jgi:tellurite resistance protein